MAVMEFLKIGMIALSGLATLISLAVAFFKAWKAKKTAKTEAAKTAAVNEMLLVVDEFINAAEQMYVGFDSILKSRGATAGPAKKENVMTKLQAYALSKGYEYDAAFWDKIVTDRVALTKVVNAKTE